MEELYKNIASMNWWIGVVIVGIAVNLISEYVKSPIDWAFSQVSIRWDRRSKEARAAREEQVQKLRERPDEQMLWIALETRYRIAMLLNVLGVLTTLITNLSIKFATTGGHSTLPEAFVYWATKLVLVVGLFCIISAMRNLAAANRCFSIVREAQQ